MKSLLLVSFLLLTVGCSTNDVLLYHPTTGETVKCGPYDNYSQAQINESKCIDDYQTQGFKKFPPTTSSSTY